MFGGWIDTKFKIVASFQAMDVPFKIEHLKFNIQKLSQF